MKNYFILLPLLALTSCSSFERMKYRHVDKVPATPQQFSTAEREYKSFEKKLIRVDSVPLPVQETTQIVIDTFVVSDVDVLAPIGHEMSTPMQDHLAVPVLKTNETYIQPVRHDWSAFIGLMLLMGGFALLLFCIVVIPYAGFPIVATILLELLLLYFVWRSIGTGTRYLLTRYRRRSVDFSEK